MSFASCDWRYDFTWRLTGPGLPARGRRSPLHGSSWRMAMTEPLAVACLAACITLRSCPAMSTLRLRTPSLLSACLPISRPHYLIVSILTLLSAPTLAANEAQPPDLAGALQAATARDPEAAQLRLRQVAAEAGVQVAQGLTPAPAAVSLNHLSDRLNQNQGRREWEVELGTPLWLPGQRRANLDTAQQALAETQARLNWRRLQLSGELREAWWQLAQARANASLANQREQAAKALEADVLRRYQYGDLARVDANLAKAESLAAESELMDANLKVQQARQAYAELTGAEAPGQLQPEALPTQTAASDETHPQTRWLQTTAALASDKLALQAASDRASPELAMRWTQQRSDALNPYDQAIGIKLTLPLSSGPRVQQDNAQARAELAQAEQALARTREHIERTIQQARQELDIADQQLTLTQARRQLTADNLQLAQKAFSLGEQDLNALLRARLADHEAQAALSRQALARDTAISRLRQALGLLPEEAQP
ncbi:TolC family protein [Aquabacterium sp.]|uniref:TolC family protein n=1 Tax=Aquabacterium sp. TaxID=1872578 RepID=UPI0025BD653C|nr:TolC family protein [Aquabacterium sp.]